MRTRVILDPRSYARPLATADARAISPSMPPSGSNTSRSGRSRTVRLAAVNRFAVVPRDTDAQAADRSPAVRWCAFQVRTGVRARRRRQGRTRPRLVLVHIHG